MVGILTLYGHKLIPNLPKHPEKRTWPIRGTLTLYGYHVIRV